MNRGPRFGLFFPQHHLSWDGLLTSVQMAEKLGFDHAWVFDHLMPVTGDAAGPILEAWTLLAGLAAKTSRIHLGVLVSSNLYRHPALLLKQAITVDHISGGRLVLGVGPGGNPREDLLAREYEAYGIPLPPANERVDRLRETLHIAHALMAGDRTDFQGQYYQLQDASFEPKSVQQPRIPMLVAAMRPQTIRLAARYADIWDTAGDLETISRQVEMLRGSCQDIGRDHREIRFSIHAGADSVQSEGAFLDWFSAFRTLGFTDFTVSLPGPLYPESVRRIAAQVLPSLRREHCC